MEVSRREFLAIGAGLMLWPRFGSWAMPPEDPHFFLQILPTFPAGWDTSYFFDARPLAMTQAGLIQNYLKEDPAPWTGANGVSLLATRLTKPLAPFREYFSVLNGVYMSSINGHDQNVNYLLTGNTAGGASFIPELNLPGAFHRVIDAVQRGRLRAPLTNSSGTVPFSVTTARNLIRNLSAVPVPSASDPLFGSILGRYATLGTDEDSFAAGSAAMHDALAATPDLVAKIRGLQLSDREPDDDLSFVRLAGQLFRLGVARSAILCLDAKKRNFDTHDPKSASEQPAAFSEVAATLAAILKFLRETPYDAKRSLLDVTTFLVTSEFGRSMRQYGQAVDATGTDHNQYSNSVLVGGKGIRGNLVIGASDFQSAGEKLSPAHLAADPGKLMVMGKPFDFAKMMPRDDLSNDLDPARYLTFNSVANTIYRAFGVDASHYRKLQNNGPLAPVLSGLLA